MLGNSRPIGTHLEIHAPEDEENQQIFNESEFVADIIAVLMEYWKLNWYNIERASRLK